MPLGLIFLSASNALFGALLVSWVVFGTIRDGGFGGDIAILITCTAFASLGIAMIVFAACAWSRRILAWRVAIISQTIEVVLELAGVALGIFGAVEGGWGIVLTVLVGIPSLVLLVASVGALLYLRSPHVRGWFGVRPA